MFEKALQSPLFVTTMKGSAMTTRSCILDMLYYRAKARDLQYGDSLPKGILNGMRRLGLRQAPQQERNCLCFRRGTVERFSQGCNRSILNHLHVIDFFTDYRCGFL